MKFRCSACLLIPVLCAAAQPHAGLAVADPVALQGYCGPPVLLGLLLFEGIGTAISYYAALPRFYGDKVIGWFFAANAAAMLAFAVIAYFAVNNDLPLPDRAGQGVLMLGMGYGLSRLAVYNLLHATGHSLRRRFIRNLIEYHAAYIAPLFLQVLVEKML